MHLWSQLPSSLRIQSALKRVADANSARYRTTDLMTEVMADQALTDFLPRLGYGLKPQFYQSWQTKGPSQWWEVEQYPYLSLRTQIQRDLPDAAERTMLDDGRLHERITTEKALALWTAKRNTYRTSTKPIAEGGAPYYLAAALGAMPGPMWQETSDGTAIERTLPNWPFRYAPSAQPLPLQLQSLLCVDLISWVVLPANTIDNPSPVAEIVHISGVGSHTKLRNFSNAFHNNKREIFRLPQDNHMGSATDHLPARRLDGGGNYDLYVAGPLEKSGRVHQVLNHYSVNHPRVGKPFLYLTGLDGLPYWPWFLQQMEIASPFPVDPAWAEQVWSEGLKHTCIIELPSRGVRGFWVRSDDPTWDRIISKCAGGTGDEVAESVGTVETTLISADSDDDTNDDAEA